MLSIMTESISNSSFAIYFPKFTGTIFEVLSAPVSYGEVLLGYVGAAATKSVILGALILVTARLFVPYEICFIHNTVGSNSAQVRNIGWAFDCILYLDMFVCFHTTYVNHRSVKVINAVKIRKHYLAHGFAYDLIASLPFDFIAFFAFGTNYSVLRWFRAPRLLRCVDIVKCFSRMRIKAKKNKNKDDTNVETKELASLPWSSWFSFARSE